MTVAARQTHLEAPAFAFPGRHVEEPVPLRLLYLISNLEYGGAQRQVIELANGLNATGAQAHICCLSDYVPLAEHLHNASRCLHILAKRHKFDFTVVGRIAELLQRLRIDVVHTFLFDAEIAGRLAGRQAGSVAVIGSERNSDYKRKWRHSIALRLTRRHFDAIIANSAAGKRFQMHTLSIDPRRIFVVRNGVNLTRFAPKDASQLRAKLGIPSGARVVGMFSSFKRQKNHAMFFRMAKRVRQAHPCVKFMCVGAELHGGLQGSDRYRVEMLHLVESMGLSDVLLCLGNRPDIASLYNLCDVTVLTSRREGTPNTLLESMACRVPVVATDVADNRFIVPSGRVGYIVPYDDDRAMTERVLELLKNNDLRASLGLAARQWVESEFSIRCMLERVLTVYLGVLRRRPGTIAA